MIHFKKFLLICLIAASIAANASDSLSAPAERNPTCPVMLNERTKDKFYADYQGKRIYFCCRQCVKSFKKNPDKYFSAANSTA